MVRRGLLLAGLACLACMVGCSSDHISLSAKDQKAVLARAQQIISAANRHDAAAVRKLAWARSSDMPVLANCPKNRKQSERLIRSYFPNWHGLSLAEHRKGHTVFVRLYLLAPASRAYSLLMQRAVLGESEERPVGPVVIVEVASAQQIYCMPLIEVSQGEWRAMAIPDGMVNPQHLLGSEGVRPLDLPRLRP